MKKLIGLALLLVVFTITTQSLAQATSKKERIENLTSLIKMMESVIEEDKVWLKYVDAEISRRASQISRTSYWHEYERVIGPLKKYREESRKLLEEKIDLLNQVRDALKKVESIPE